MTKISCSCSSDGVGKCAVPHKFIEAVDKLKEDNKPMTKQAKHGVIYAIALCGVLWCGVAWARTVAGYDVERLATAIYHAEGGAKTAHPYGILAKYKTTTPRQACINTINSKYRAWLKTDRKLDYLSYLASKYAPVGVANDPTGLNKNWLGNVRRLYAKGGGRVK